MLTFKSIWFRRFIGKSCHSVLALYVGKRPCQSSKKDLLGSLQLLNWAERRKRDYERAFSCMKYAEILLDLNETERAQAYLKNVNQILIKHIKEDTTGGAIGQGSKTLDTQTSRRTLRKKLTNFADSNLKFYSSNSKNSQHSMSFQANRVNFTRISCKYCNTFYWNIFFEVFPDIYICRNFAVVMFG